MSKNSSHTHIHAGDYYRAQYVRRWHIVNMVRDQSVAEHSWAVAMLADHLIELLADSGLMTGWQGNGGLNLDIVKMATMRYAIYHDAREVVYGDVPATVKAAAAASGEPCFDSGRGDRATQAAVNWIMSAGTVTVTHLLPNVSPSVAVRRYNLLDLVKWFVKVADLMEALRYVRDNGADCGHTNRSSEYIGDSLSRALANPPSPVGRTGALAGLAPAISRVAMTWFDRDVMDVAPTFATDL